MIEYVKMNRSHLEGLLEVEAQCFGSPFAKTTFEKEFENKIAIYVVATENETVLGYAGVWNMCGTADIIDVGVRRDFRRRGIGLGLLQNLEERCQKQGVFEINLEVRKSNIPAQTLYEKNGYKVVGLRRGYYENGEDAILMKKVLEEGKTSEDTCN